MYAVLPILLCVNIFTSDSKRLQHVLEGKCVEAQQL